MASELNPAPTDLTQAHRSEASESARHTAGRFIRAVAVVGLAATSVTMRATEQAVEATVAPGADFNVVFDPPRCNLSDSQLQVASSLYYVGVTGLRPNTDPTGAVIDGQMVSAKNLNDNGLDWHSTQGYAGGSVADATGKATLFHNYLGNPDYRILNIEVDVHSYPGGPVIASKVVTHEFSCNGQQTPPPGEAPPKPLPELPSPGEPSKLVPIAPERSTDTRIGLNTGGAIGPLQAGGKIEVDVAGRPGAPANVTAVVMTATTIGSKEGFWTAYPSGTARPTTSFANTQRPGDIEPTTITVPVGPNGRVTVFSQNGGHFVNDIAGYYAKASSSADGRYQEVANARLYDSRTTPGNQMDPGEILNLPILGHGGVPASGVEAVEINVTADQTEVPGYYTVYPSDKPQPVASVVNYAPTDSKTPDSSTVANTIIVPVGADGSINVFSSGKSQLVVDLIATFTDKTAPVATRGLYQSVKPVRDEDTRGRGVKAQSFEVLPIDLSETGLDVSQYIAVRGVYTMTSASQPTFGAVFSGNYAGTSTGNTSSTRASGFVSRIPASMLVNNPTDEIVDVSGVYRK